MELWELRITITWVVWTEGGLLLEIEHRKIIIEDETSGSMPSFS